MVGGVGRGPHHVPDRDVVHRVGRVSSRPPCRGERGRSRARHHTGGVLVERAKHQGTGQVTVGQRGRGGGDAGARMDG